MRHIKYAVFVVAILIAGLSYAKPVDRGGLSIQRIHPMAVDRTHCASCSGITRIYVNGGAWGDTSCRVDAGDLFKEDDHILSVLLLASATGKEIRIEVNDEVQPIDEVCKITAVYVEG